MEARHPVEWVASASDATDDYGNPVEAWADPVTVYVYGWAPAGSVERNGWQRQVEADLQLFATPDFPATAADRVVVDGRTYDVQGEPEDYNHGPFGYTPGVVVNLTRVDG